MTDSIRGRLSGIEVAQVASAPEIGNVEAGVVASPRRRPRLDRLGRRSHVIGTAVCALALPALVRYDREGLKQ